MSIDWKMALDDLMADYLKTKHQRLSIQKSNSKMKKRLLKVVKRRQVLQSIEEYAKPNDVDEETWEEYPRFLKWEKLLQSPVKHHRLRRFLDSFGNIDLNKKMTIITRIFAVIDDDIDRFYKIKKPVLKNESPEDITLTSVLACLDVLANAWL